MRCASHALLCLKNNLKSTICTGWVLKLIGAYCLIIQRNHQDKTERKPVTDYD